MLFLHKDEVLEIHRQLIGQFVGSTGIRDEGLLESALLAAANREHYEGANLPTYAFHLTRNHPFGDGNKRVGAAVAEVFLRLNGVSLIANNDEIVALSMGIAAGTIPREDVEQAFMRWVS